MPTLNYCVCVCVCALFLLWLLFIVGDNCYVESCLGNLEILHDSNWDTISVA